MAEPATYHDKRFIFLKDFEGKEVPVFLGSIVSAINTGAVPGFLALNKEEAETVNEVLIDAEHHHREQLHDPENWEKAIVIEKKIMRVRIRLGLELHYEKPEHCPYLSHRVIGEGMGL